MLSDLVLSLPSSVWKQTLVKPIVSVDGIGYTESWIASKNSQVLDERWEEQQWELGQLGSTSEGFTSIIVICSRIARKTNKIMQIKSWLPVCWPSGLCHMVLNRKCWHEEVIKILVEDAWAKMSPISGNYLETLFWGSPRSLYCHMECGPKYQLTEVWLLCVSSVLDRFKGGLSMLTFSKCRTFRLRFVPWLRRDMALKSSFCFLMVRQCRQDIELASCNIYLCHLRKDVRPK